MLCCIEILHSSFLIKKKVMVKRILLSIVMLMLIAYLGIAITAFNRKPADQTCRDVELVIKDTAYAGFINGVATVVVLGFVSAISLYITVRMVQGAKAELAAKKRQA